MKRLLINGKSKEVEDSIQTVSQLLEHLNIPEGGTAVAVNNNLVKAIDRETKMIKSGDIITIITAAYGG